MSYYDVELTAVIHVGVEAPDKDTAVAYAKEESWRHGDEFTDNVECSDVEEIDEEDYEDLEIKYE